MEGKREGLKIKTPKITQRTSAACDDDVRDGQDQQSFISLHWIFVS